MVTNKSTNNNGKTIFLKHFIDFYVPIHVLHISKISPYFPVVGLTFENVIVFVSIQPS